MARMTKTIGFTAPPSLIQEYEQIAQEERRTKSELFRRMFSAYKTYRKQLEQAEVERFERLINEAMLAGQREKQDPTITDKEYDQLEADLVRYGAEQTTKIGIDVTDENSINDLIYAERTRWKERQK